MTPAIRVAGIEDAEGLAALHARSFSTPWDADSIRALLRQTGCDALLAAAPAPAGFLLMRTIVDESEILTVAVDPAMRRRGLAGKLLAEGLKRAAALGSRVCHLEVAHDNVAAISLYRAHGFVECGRRPSYYARGHSTVPAIVMKRDEV